MKRLSDELKSRLTAAKLKALCIINDLPTSGNKSDLVDRLIESGLSKKELGIEELAGETTAKASASEELDALQPSLSLEDDDTITPEVEPPKEAIATPVVLTVSDDDILDAEVLDAEFITLDEEVKAPKIQVVKQPTTKSADSPATLLDMIK
ncbi:MAG: SAP domain-containing protein, partial [Candidatus Poseidoniaceae archaeon]|nr:SAP domain-containing protein [Candidatus Poseidoniaceae archaeon]